MPLAVRIYVRAAHFGCGRGSTGNRGSLAGAALIGVGSDEIMLR